MDGECRKQFIPIDEIDEWAEEIKQEDVELPKPISPEENIGLVQWLDKPIPAIEDVIDD